jgi:hypothetical protein
MKKFLTRYAIFYTLTSFVAFFLAVLLIRIQDLVTLRPGELFLGATVVALLLTVSLTIFKARWGNGIWNVVLAYLIITPIPFVIRIMYINLFFRVFRLIYVIIGLSIIIYMIVLFVIHRHNKKTEKELSALLEKKTK